MFNKIEAIKIVRAELGIGLKEAKDLVESLGSAKQEIVTTYQNSMVPFIAGVLDMQDKGYAKKDVNASALLDKVTACIEDEREVTINDLRRSVEYERNRANSAEYRERELRDERDDLTERLAAKERVTIAALQHMSKEMTAYGVLMESRMAELLAEIEDVRIKLALAEAQIAGHENTMTLMRRKHVAGQRPIAGMPTFDEFLEDQIRSMMDEMDTTVRDDRDLDDAEDYRRAIDREERDGIF